MGDVLAKCFREAGSATVIDYKGNLREHLSCSTKRYSEELQVQKFAS